MLAGPCCSTNKPTLHLHLCQSVKAEVKNSLKSYLVELVLYSALVAGYYFLVLEFLGDWLHHIYEDNRKTYAGIALGLILAQGFVLEVLTRVLLAWIKPRTEEE